MTGIVISISQSKGGASKTTTSINLAGALIELGANTVVYDWDVAKPDATKVWRDAGNFIDWIKEIDTEDPVSEINKAKEKYSVIIFDTPPNYEQNAFKAILASDYVLIPTSANFLEQENTKKAVSLPMLANKPFKLIMNRIKKGTKDGRQVFSNVADQDICLKSVITERAVVAKSSEFGKWVGDYAKNSDSHKQYLQLAKEVLEWIDFDFHTCGIKAEMSTA